VQQRVGQRDAAMLLQRWHNWHICFLVALAPQLGRAQAPKGAWDAFNYAPSSRTVFPVSVRETGGDADVSAYNGTEGAFTLSGAGAYVTLDFGKEVRALWYLSPARLTGPRAGWRSHLAQL
jgi:hypothetical protein